MKGMPMSLATSEPRNAKFLTRFEHVWASLRRYQLGQGLAWSCLAAILGAAALALADYRLELPLRARAAGLLVAMAITLAVFFGRVLGPLRWWTKRRTAAEIEGRFPELGQRIRTVVQYAGLTDDRFYSEGVTPSLVSALEDETEIKTHPLPLDRLVPWGRVWAVAALAATPALILLIAAIADPEWRIALSRALLGNRPYTTLSVAPGDLTVDQGEPVAVAVELHGRVKRDVVLWTRPAAEPNAAWKVAAIDPPDRGPAFRRDAKIEKVQHPFDYRVVAGPAASPTYRIGVRYPLAIQSFEVGLVPPAYTNVKPSTVKGGDLRVIEGTDATFHITFDSPPAEASLVVTDPSIRPKKGKAETATQVIPLASAGGAYTAGLHLTKGLVLEIAARTADGRALPEHRYKIDVIEDRPPRVSFEQPDEALEVHPIAEILNRVRVGDDFGLVKAGIVFQFNNGDEQTLVLKDFAKEPGKAETSAALQEMLLLEKLAATPTDSLTYYAFAEDNYPAGARRTETDLRYLDIRPFKREYKLRESGDDVGEPGDLASLAELIARQRFNLNRATRLAKHKPTDKSFAEDPLKIAGFEETLVQMTREFTEGVEGIVGERIEPLHAAEESMLAAVAALDRSQNARAPGHMGDALRHLIEARNTIQMAIADDPKAQAALRGFDRTQAQKIRRPKKEREEAEEIAEEIEAIAKDEDFVYATLSGLQIEQPDSPPQKAEQGERGEGETEKKAEPAEKKKEERPKDASKQKGPKGTQGAGKGAQGKGQAGEKGEPDDDGDPGEPAQDKRRDAVKRQEQVADKARELEEKLKKLEVASDLAKVRMTKAAETAEKASGALARGNTKEATETAKAGAAMLHELARQVKGELARDVAQELAMARDLADELAQREAELSQMGGGADPSSRGADQPSPGDKSGEPEKDQPGKGNKPGDAQNNEPGKGDKPDDAEGNEPGKGDAEGNEPGKGAKPGKNGRGASGNDGRGDAGGGGWGDLTDAERLERLQEAGRTLEQWLKDASLRAEGDAAGRIRELLEEKDVTKIVERMEQIRELYRGGRVVVARREANDLSKALELLARQLEVLHRGIVAPEIAALVEFDRRVSELMERLKTVRTNAEITEWRRDATELIRDLEKAGLSDAATTLTGAFDAAGWDWGGDYRARVVPAGITVALRSVTLMFQEKIQNLVLKDMASAHDEATPPEFKELVERYYEVLSKEGGRK
jgi:hypothetical protein